MTVNLQPFPSIDIPASAVRDLQTQMARVLGDSRKPVLPVFRDPQVTNELLDAARSTLADVHAQASPYLFADDSVGAVALSTPETVGHGVTGAFLKTLILVSFVQLGGPLARDRLNGTPFTVYGASEENRDAMAAAGLHNLTPDAVLGFHCDGAFEQDSVYMPRIVGLQNVVLNYGKPGNFYWVPFAQWDQGKALLDRHRDALVEINATPIAHREMGRGDVVVDRTARIQGPVVWQEAAGNIVAFLNGTPQEESAEVFLQVQQSFADNGTRYFVEHGINRLVCLRNDRGVHARDILEEGQASGSQTSRMLLRSLSGQGTPVPSRVE